MAAESSVPPEPAAQASAPPAEAPASPSYDGDSAFEPSISDMTDTTSIGSSIQKYRKEFGRTYHSYGLNEYWGPNDETMQDHMDIGHQFYTLLLDGKLITAPITHVNRVLDLGTGTGIWAIDFADEHSEANVKGIDLSPIQPSFVPPNCRFEVDDFNLEFLDENKFELIHQRELLGCVPDWPAFYRKCFNALTPGGWIDIVEPDSNGYYSAANDGKVMDDVAGKENPLGTFSRLFAEAAKASGMDGNITPKLEGWLKDAGFVNVQVKIHKPAVGSWPKDKKERDIGAWNRLLLETGLEGIYMRLLCSQLGWTPDEVTVQIAKTKQEYRNHAWKLFREVYSVAAQRPLEPASAA